MNSKQAKAHLKEMGDRHAEAVAKAKVIMAESAEQAERRAIAKARKRA